MTNNITVPVVTIFDREDKTDITIEYKVSGDTPEEQKQKADAYAEQYAKWNKIEYRTIKTYVGVTMSTLQKLQEHVKHVFGF